MTITTLPTKAAPPAVPTTPADNALGEFLRDRRARVTPKATVRGRRRTPGLRREEVAARADVSVTWYTWLEQGRGGPPSADVLERLAGALELDESGREVLFLLAQQRPPPVRVGPPPAVSPTLRRVLDAMPTSPAYVKTRAWDVVAWNRAAAIVFTDLATLRPGEWNIIRRMFESKARTRLPDWENNVRALLAAFRVDAARSGGCPEVAALIADLQASSPDFRRLWAEHDVKRHGFGSKRVHHPTAGPFTLEFSAFAVDGADGLDLVVFTPATEADAKALETLVGEMTL